MSKKTRLIILLICVMCFFVIAPVLVAYSVGYRFDFEKGKVVSTGGIYVRTFPAAELVIIDSKISTKPGIFSNAVFVQSLLPKEHTVSVTKDGYYDYFKTLQVKERAVTKLENITLFKKSLIFTTMGSANYMSIAPNNQNIITTVNSLNHITVNYFNLNSKDDSQKITIPEKGGVLEIKWSDDSNKAIVKTQTNSGIVYYIFENLGQAPIISRLAYLDSNSEQISFNPRDLEEIFYQENNILYSLKNNEPSIIIKGLVTYQISGNNILWLSTDGLLFTSDFAGKLLNEATEENITVSQSKTYKILNVSSKTFLKDGVSTFLLNPGTKAFEEFNGPEGNYEILNSPDNKNLILWNNDKIYVYSFSDEIYEELFSESKISNCQWLNNDYIIIAAENNIIISEIDYRGNINTVTLPIETKSPETYFVSQTGKLYILTDGSLLESEKITP